MRTFPIMRERSHGHTDPIPWEVIAPHEKQALKNHMQTLERLAERGGLCPSEAVAVLENRPWRAMPDAEERLREIVALRAGPQREP